MYVQASWSIEQAVVIKTASGIGANLSPSSNIDNILCCTKECLHHSQWFQTGNSRLIKEGIFPCLHFKPPINMGSCGSTKVSLILQDQEKATILHGNQSTAFGLTSRSMSIHPARYSLRQMHKPHYLIFAHTLPPNYFMVVRTFLRSAIQWSSFFMLRACTPRMFTTRTKGLQGTTRLKVEGYNHPTQLPISAPRQHKSKEIEQSSVPQNGGDKITGGSICEK